MMLIDAELSAQTRNAIARLREQYKVCNNINKEAVLGVIKDVLDEEFTKIQYGRIPWSEYGMAPAMNIEYLCRLGWVESRIVETDMWLSEKEGLAKNRVIVTYKDGSTSTQYKSTSVSYIPDYQQIVGIRDATPEDITEKNETYYYHVVD